jgi:glutamate-1-semialdehyde 2,1-aminomutase
VNSLDQINKMQGESSKVIYERACEVIAGGVSRNTIFRKPYPYYAASAKGSYITDIDGTEYIDFANNMGSLIHGHSHPAIVDEVIKQLHKGSAYSMGTEAEVTFAELLMDRAKGFEKIRFVNSGTEAVMAMIKASRAYTGKPKIAKAEGAYHGTYDYAEMSQISNPSNWGSLDKPNAVPLVQGTPKGVVDDTVIFPYNDIERTLNILDQNKGQIACVIIDPVPHRIGLFPATKAFVEAVYDWTRKNNAILAFDEVISFRVNYAGAQAGYMVDPDLITMGKIIGGGFPIGALAGKSEIMQVLDAREKVLRYPHSGTFSANPISMTAGRVAMELYDEKAVSSLNAMALKARHQIGDAIRTADVPISITGAGSMFRMHFQPIAPTTYREAFQTIEIKDLINELLDYLFLKENILMINTCSCILATTLTQKEIDRLSEALLNGFKLIKPKLDQLI